MKKFVILCEKVQYLGLLGLLGFVFEQDVLKLFWLFWLFGFVHIFYNFQIFLQSLKQIGGIIVIPFYYGFRLPNVENYQCKVKYSLPFDGAWTVVNGGIDKASSHSWGIYTQRYAYDFVILDQLGHSRKGESTNPNEYYCYDKKILAPADGEVAELRDEYDDSIILGNGQVDCSASDIRGNYVLICHANKEYSLLAHLKRGSVGVKIGDKLKRGQYIARCGNSGNSSEPHLHFQLQDNRSFHFSAGLPIEFENIRIESAFNYSTFDSRKVPAMAKEIDKYIMRGQSVVNN